MNDLLQQLEALAAVHDFYYDYSDDHSVWKKGNEKQKLIDALYRKCKNLGYEEEALSILIGLAPSDPNNFN